MLFVPTIFTDVMDKRTLVVLALAVLVFLAGAAMTILTSLPTFVPSQPSIEEPSKISTGAGLVTLTVVKKGAK